MEKERQSELERERGGRQRPGDGCVCMRGRLNARVIPVIGNQVTEATLLQLLQNTARTTTPTST